VAVVAAAAAELFPAYRCSFPDLAVAVRLLLELVGDPSTLKVFRNKRTIASHTHTRTHTLNPPPPLQFIAHTHSEPSSRPSQRRIGRTACEACPRTRGPEGQTVLVKGPWFIVGFRMIQVAGVCCCCHALSRPKTQSPNARLPTGPFNHHHHHHRHPVSCPVAL
jgi:hypothetical protein